MGLPEYAGNIKTTIKYWEIDKHQLSQSSPTTLKSLYKWNIVLVQAIICIFENCFCTFTALNALNRYLAFENLKN